MSRAAIVFVVLIVVTFSALLRRGHTNVVGSLTNGFAARTVEDVTVPHRDESWEHLPAPFSLIAAAFLLVLLARIRAGDGFDDVLACLLTILAFALHHSMLWLRFAHGELKLTAARLRRNGRRHVDDQTPPDTE